MGERVPILEADQLDAWRSRSARVGVWNAALGEWPAELERRYAREVERLGYASLWIGENPGNKEALVHAGLLLAATDHLVVGTGIASVWGRDAFAAHNGGQALAEAYDGRFVLGLGVSHRVLTEARGTDYSGPLTTMSEYLTTLAAVDYRGPAPVHPLPTVIAALRPRMVALAARKADGAHTYLVTPEHTRGAREALGPTPLLIVEQGFVLETDAPLARRQAREHLHWYLGQPNYQAAMRAEGFAESDLAHDGSDGLVDAIVAWGSLDLVTARVAAHLDAGADQVLLQPLAGSPEEQLSGLGVVAGALDLV
jgi:probable F420-dependent oxidoreductase